MNNWIRQLIIIWVASLSCGCTTPTTPTTLSAAKSALGGPTTPTTTPVNSPTTTTEPAAPVSAEEQPGGLVEVFPHVFVDAEHSIVEFDAVVPITVTGPNSPTIWLEVIACTPGTKEHEALVVTGARPSHVHAALLLIGLRPGEPGAWREDGEGGYERVPPTGDAVRISFVVEHDGQQRVEPAESWVLDARTGEPMSHGSWVFAGSRIVDWSGEPRYDADWAGTLIGLATFGSETLAWSEVVSPETSVDEPAWHANPASTPACGTAVRVRIEPVQDG
ncbi:MAG: hypothetical protein KAS72_03635 [Phycisphaerales bacterium]|nr:hypothetical protein [Phycisphaerales bacterium]